MSTWNVYEQYQDQARPFDFVIVGFISQDREDVAACPQYCCKTPRPSCLLFDNPAEWREQDWRCLHCGKRWEFASFPRLRTYGELVERTLWKVDRKRLKADGNEPSSVMRGVTIARPVRVEKVTHIGKELVVDPTDTAEEQTAEQLNATNVLQYHNEGERREKLRVAIKRIGIAAVSRKSTVSTSHVQAFVNQGSRSSPTTIQKLETAVREMMGRRQAL
jgi:hypothetical protein